MTASEDGCGGTLGILLLSQVVSVHRQTFMHQFIHSNRSVV